MKIFLGKQRVPMPLNQKDLQDQLSKNPYWVPSCKKRLKSVGNIWCWGVNLDLHPFGLQQATSEQLEAYFTDDSLGDPRQGELFAIVSKLLESGSE